MCRSARTAGIAAQKEKAKKRKSAACTADAVQAALRAIRLARQRQITRERSFAETRSITVTTAITMISTALVCA